MTYKQRVLSVYPESKIRRYKQNDPYRTDLMYLATNALFSGHGETPREAWKDMWGRNQYRMIKKLEQ